MRRRGHEAINGTIIKVQRERERERERERADSQTDRQLTGVSTRTLSRIKELSGRFFSFIQFNVPFKIISLIEASQSIGAAKREYPGKTT